MPHGWHLHLFEIPVDTVFFISRAVVLGILVSSEALLARHKRVGFERHLILFSAFSLLMAAELFGIAFSLSDPQTTLRQHAGIWVWYPVLSVVGLLGVAFCFDFVGAQQPTPPKQPLRLRRPDAVPVQMTGAGVDQPSGGVRRHSRRYLMLATFVLAFGTLLSTLPFEMKGLPTTQVQMGRAAFALHGLQAAAMLLLAWKAGGMSGVWLSQSESRVFLLGCLTGALGALFQLGTGPREHFTTLAFTLFVAVFLRDNYRRSERETVRASEDRNAKTLLFHRITTQLKSTFEPSALHEILMDSLVSNLGAESGAIYIRNAREDSLTPVLLHGPYPPPWELPEPLPDDWREVRDAVERTPVPVGAGVVGRVAADGIPLYVFDSADAARHYRWPIGPTRVHTTIALPLRSPEGIYGVVQVVNRMDAAAFSEEDLRFMSLFVEQAGLAIYNARQHARVVEQHRAEEQLKIARQIQLRLIPSDLPVFPGLSIGAEYSAAQEVGGDYFDFYRIDHDHIGVVVFDVAGKGVPGALLMSITSTFLKMAAPRSTSPAWVLNEVNAALSAEMRQGLYVTAVYGVLKLSTLELTLCCAGHTDAIVVRDQDLSCERHNPSGAALGLLRPNRFRNVLGQETVRLGLGDTLLFYTDGVIEAMNEHGEEFGEERLEKVAKEFARQGPRRLAAEIANAVRRHAGDRPQYDDITVVALRTGPNSTDTHAVPVENLSSSPSLRVEDGTERPETP